MNISLTTTLSIPLGFFSSRYLDVSVRGVFFYEVSLFGSFGFFFPPPNLSFLLRPSTKP